MSTLLNILACIYLILALFAFVGYFNIIYRTHSGSPGSLYERMTGSVNLTYGLRWMKHVAVLLAALLGTFDPTLQEIVAYTAITWIGLSYYAVYTFYRG